MTEPIDIARDYLAQARKHARPAELIAIAEQREERPTTEAMQIRMARCTEDDLEQMRDFLFDFEEQMDNPELDDNDKMQWLETNYRERCGRHWQRLITGYEVLVDNVCDKSLTYLDWKPNLKELLP